MYFPAVNNQLSQFFNDDFFYASWYLRDFRGEKEDKKGNLKFAMVFKVVNAWEIRKIREFQFTTV